MILGFCDLFIQGFIHTRRTVSLKLLLVDLEIERIVGRNLFDNRRQRNLLNKLFNHHVLKMCNLFRKQRWKKQTRHKIRLIIKGGL